MTTGRINQVGWRVRTPWTTPANGGSHGAAPPRNPVSGVASGHPSTDSSGAGGQRAPGLQAPPRRPRRGRSPDAARRGSRGSPMGAGAGHEAHQHTRPRKGIHQAGKVTTADGLTKSRASSGRCGGETLRLTSTHTLRPSLGGCHPCNRSVPKTQLEYGSVTMGLVWRWSVHDILPIVSGPVFMRKTRRGAGLRNFWPAVRGRQLANPSRQLANPSRQLANPSRQLANPSRQLANPSRQLVNPRWAHPTRPGYISLVHLTGGWYIYIFPTIVVLAALSPTPTALPPSTGESSHHVRPSASAAAACRGSDTLRRPPLRAHAPGEAPSPTRQLAGLTPRRARRPAPRCPRPPAPPREEGRLAGAGPKSGWGARMPSRRRRGGSTGHWGWHAGHGGYGPLA